MYVVGDWVEGNVGNLSFGDFKPPFQLPLIIFIWGPHSRGEERNVGLFVRTIYHTHKQQLGYSVMKVFCLLLRQQFPILLGLYHKQVFFRIRGVSITYHLWEIINGFL